MVLQNGEGYLKRLRNDRPVNTSFISSRPEESWKRYRANCLLFKDWRRKSTRKDSSVDRYKELEDILKNGHSTYKEAWEEFLEQNKDKPWTKTYFAREAILAGEKLAEQIEFDAAQKTVSEGHEQSVEEPEYIDSFDVYEENTTSNF